MRNIPLLLLITHKKICTHLRFKQIIIFYSIQNLFPLNFNNNTAKENPSVPYSLILGGLDNRGAGWNPAYMSHLERDTGKWKNLHPADKGSKSLIK